MYAVCLLNTGERRICRTWQGAQAILHGKSHSRVKKFINEKAATLWMDDIMKLHDHDISLQLGAESSRAAESMITSRAQDVDKHIERRRAQRTRPGKRQRDETTRAVFSTMQQAVVSTDGACQDRGNSRVAAMSNVWHPYEGDRLKTPYTSLSAVLSRDEEHTNQRAELKAITVAVETVLNDRMSSTRIMENVQSLLVRTDSKWCIQGLTDWAPRLWVKNDWKTSNGDQVKHVDMWKRALHAITRLKEYDIEVAFVHVRSHRGDEFNEKADQEASRAIDIACT